MAFSFIETLKEKFGEAVVEAHSFRGDDTVVVQSGTWIEVCSFLKDGHGLTMLLDLCGVDRQKLPEKIPAGGGRFEVVAHLYQVKGGGRLRVKTRCSGENPVLPTITAVFPAANWFEREAFDLFGIEFKGHPNLKRLLCHHEFVGHALRKDFPKDRRGQIPKADTLIEEVSENYMYLNLGPSHPATHGCFRILLKLDGETVVKAVPEIGYLHRSLEKEAEAHNWHAIIPYTDRMNYMSPLMNNVGYCMAVEKLIGLSIPERAQWIRMLVSEVSRICDHLVCIGVNLVDVGALSNFWYLFNAREKFTDWIEALCGARLTTNYARIGGVARDLPEASRDMLRGCVDDLHRSIKDVCGLIKRNRIFLDRTQGVGAISEREAVDYGFTGPCLRATGLDYDVRRAHPYCHYSELDWDIPVGSNGDTYDRIFVRMEEMHQSARMIEQIFEKMPRGDILRGAPDVVFPEPHEVYGSIEGMIRQFKLVMHGISPPAGEVYSYTEAANGELGFYLMSDGGPKPYRLKVRPPCFAIYQALPRLIEGHMVADVVAVLGSLNIIAGELDR